MAKKHTAICRTCGKVFTPKNNPIQIFCDRTCFFASKAGLSREEMLASQKKENPDDTMRKCHDCGRPTIDYRCPSCWAKIRNKSVPSGIPEYDVRGEVDGDVWLQSVVDRNLLAQITRGDKR